MKAVVLRDFGPIGSASVEEIPEPLPQPHEVVVEVALAPVNFVDLLVLQGKYQFLPERPFTPGKGPVGTVKSVGSAVSRFKPGDRVLAMAEHGGYAQSCRVAEEQCYRLPDTMVFEAAASMSLAYDTAWFALMERGRLKSGECVLVLGATGAVGNAAVQIAKAKGARVLAAVSSASKGEQALAAGADGIVDLSRADLRESLREQVHAANGGQGADIVIDTLGDKVFDAAIRAVAWRGRVVVVGFAAGGIPTLKVNYVLLKNIEVSGLQISDYRKRMPDLVRTCFDDIFALHSAGMIVTKPVHRFALEAYADALEQLAGRRLDGRPVLVP